jgi:hypothetical protein
VGDGLGPADQVSEDQLRRLKHFFHPTTIQRN